jgi:hypothetical protein
MGTRSAASSAAAEAASGEAASGGAGEDDAGEDAGNAAGNSAAAEAAEAAVAEADAEANEVAGAGEEGTELIANCSLELFQSIEFTSQLSSLDCAVRLE